MAERLGRLVLQAGVIAVMLAALSFKVFELDRYFVPKELVLHAAAFLVAASLVIRRRALTVDVTDALLALFVIWTAASALFATNHWLAQRALALSVSSAVIFWGARRAGAAGAAGSQRALLVAASLATVVVAITSLAQAYGFETEYFTLARAPGGTLGNRNFIAHIVAIGLPVTVWCAVTAKRALEALVWSLAGAVLSATLVLSRSRAAWLAVAACIAVLVIPLVVSRKYWEKQRVGGRLARFLLTAVIGGALAVVLPNDLNWTSDSPYLDSARKVVDYGSGSGRGRVAQYRNSLRMAADNPVFGVGPGNWPVRYVRFAPGGDRSLADNGMTANPWPSSDWVAFISERGIVAVLALGGVFATLFVGALRRWRDLPDANAVLMKLALAGTIVTTVVVSAFDAVLLLAAPAFLAWLILGAAAAAGAGARARGRTLEPSRSVWLLVAAGAILVTVGSVARSTTQAIAMSTVGTGGRTARWVAGAMWDPGSYRINQRVADIYANRGQCGRARPFARRAAALFPSSSAARRVMRRCGIKS